ncbi:uncharacterized protein BYT42DRAFT_611588 [Radiomyces spectabilis]|uniref:uncharacterized protein n=1 Tax=Radiomyces spectabilis TaxID=64574 RepID=UPI00221E8819|nr:uncharacterized protein BYT42DRAFT_611588 [Radiomyces spectabilis]KAI8388556.1 hypothetical protein BYT42DRAFT_611588 [Radiomyces spectabilis]
MSDNSTDPLRSRYLQFWLAMSQTAPKATVVMDGKTVVQGIFRGTDSENNRFRFDQLETPMGTYERTVLRGPDRLTVVVVLYASENVYQEEHGECMFVSLALAGGTRNKGVSMKYVVVWVQQSIKDFYCAAWSPAM